MADTKTILSLADFTLVVTQMKAWVLSRVSRVEAAMAAALDDIDGSMQTVLSDCNDVRRQVYDERDRLFVQFNEKAEAANRHTDQLIERIQAEEETIATAWNDLDERLRALE